MAPCDIMWPTPDEIREALEFMTQAMVERRDHMIAMMLGATGGGDGAGGGAAAGGDGGGAGGGEDEDIYG